MFSLLSASFEPSVRLTHLGEWFSSWVPHPVFSAGGRRSSVQTWKTTALDIEESLSGIVDSDVHLFVADVVESFDTVERGVFYCVLSRLRLPGWFRRVYFEHHAHVSFRFKLVCGLGEPWTPDRGIPQGRPLFANFTSKMCVCF